MMPFASRCPCPVVCYKHLNPSGSLIPKELHVYGKNEPRNMQLHRGRSAPVRLFAINI